MLLLAVVLALAGTLLTGCIPVSQAQSDEEKEPYFMAGKTHVSAMDFKNAIESFEKAVEVNPRSGAAHFELAWLLDRKEGDPVGALYHYDRYLKLRPGAPNAETVKQQMQACKQEVARTVSLGPISQKQQNDIERMSEELKRLTEENQKLNEEVTRLRVQIAAGGVGTQPAGPERTPGGAAQPRSGAAGVSSNPANAKVLQSAVASRRTHTVKPGETLTVIARQYGIKTETLMAANPRVDSRKLRPGQTLNIP